MNSTPLAIEAEGLVKAFGETRAVDGVDLAVRGGSVYGVLGPNGAGKTTTIRMLATLMRPDAGSARVLGHDIVAEADAVRAAVSLTGQLASVDEDLTGRENLVLLGQAARASGGAPRRSAPASCSRRSASPRPPARLVKNYSGGMRRRLDIAASLVVTPRLMFLDEPTTGLDPRSRNQVWDIIRALRRRGTTILLCTQYLEEADQLADGIAVIDHGKVIAEGTPAQLKASVGSGALHVRLLDPDQRPEAERQLAARARRRQARARPGGAVRRLRGRRAGRGGASRSSSRSGVQVADFSLGQPSLDEVFLALTGHPAEEADGGSRPRHERRTTTGPADRGRRHPQGPRVDAAAAAAERLDATLAFGWRGMLKVKHVPEQLLDVTITPVMFVLLFTYLFGGAISGSTGDYLDYILPGVLVMSVLFTTVYSGVALNTDLTKGVVDRFRSLPIWTPGAARRRPARRQRALRRGRDRDHRARTDPRLPARGRGRRRARRAGAGGGVRVRAVVGVHHARADACARPTR